MFETALVYKATGCAGKRIRSLQRFVKRLVHDCELSWLYLKIYDVISLEGMCRRFCGWLKLKGA